MESLWEKLDKLGIKPNQDLEKNTTAKVVDKEIEDVSVNSSSITNEVSETLKKKGFVIIDKREQGGRLWVIGGPELKNTFDTFKQDGVQFAFTPNGSESTMNLPAWYLKLESLELI